MKSTDNVNTVIIIVTLALELLITVTHVKDLSELMHHFVIAQIVITIME